MAQMAICHSQLVEATGGGDALVTTENDGPFLKAEKGDHRG